MKRITKFLIIAFVSYLIFTLIDFGLNAKRAKLRLHKNPLIAHLVHQKEKNREKSESMLLRYYFPPILPLIKYVATGEEISSKDLTTYSQYYEKLIQTKPEQVEAHAMLGFSTYYSGNIEKSINAYHKAANLNPDFLWHHYNLGYLYYKDGQYRKSIEELLKALSTRAEPTLATINKSFVYQVIWMHVKKDIEVRLLNNFRSGLQDSYALLVLNHYHLKNFTEVIQLVQYAKKSEFNDQDFFNYTAGLASLQSKNAQQAIYYFQETIKRNPEHVLALYHLGLSLKGVGQEEMALAFLQKAAQLRQIKGEPVKKESTLKLRIF